MLSQISPFFAKHNPASSAPSSPYSHSITEEANPFNPNSNSSSNFAMSTANIRQRAAAKHSSVNSPIRILTDSNPKGGHSTWQNKKFHAGVWARIIAIISLFSLLALLISKAEKSHETAHNKNVRAGGTKRISGGGNPSFVTVVMPR